MYSVKNDASFYFVSSYASSSYASFFTKIVESPSVMLNASNSHRPEYLDIVHETIVHDSSSFLLTRASCMTVFWPETLSGSPMGLSSLRAASGSSNSISSHSLRIAYLCVCHTERGVMGWWRVSDDSWLWKRSEV